MSELLDLTPERVKELLTLLDETPRRDIALLGNPPTFDKALSKAELCTLLRTYGRECAWKAKQKATLWVNDIYKTACGAENLRPMKFCFHCGGKVVAQDAPKAQGQR